MAKLAPVIIFIVISCLVTDALFLPGLAKESGGEHCSLNDKDKLPNLWPLLLEDDENEKFSTLLIKRDIGSSLCRPEEHLRHGASNLTRLSLISTAKPKQVVFLLRLQI